MRILIVKLGALGDVLRTTGLLPALRARDPDAKVAWATSARALPLLSGLTVDAMTLEEAELVAEGSYDLVVSMEEDLRAARLARRLCRGELVGVTAEDGRLGYTESSRVYYDMSLLRPEARGGRAAADAAKAANTRGYIDLWCEVLGLRAGSSVRPLLALSAIELAAGRADAQTLIRGGGRPLIAFAPFAAGRWQAKSLSAAASARAACELAGLGATVVLLSAADRDAERRAAAASSSSVRVVDGGGARGLRGYAALLAACDAVVCVDTLSAHIAAALERPLAVLVGPTSAAEIDAGPRGRTAVPPGGCSCFYAPACRYETSCLDGLPSGFVAALGRRLLQSPAAADSPRVSVVVASFGRPALLERCLASVRAHAGPGVVQVLVTVHAQDEATERAARAAAVLDSRVELVRTRRRSRSAARNDAAPQCRGEWCYFLDDDAELFPGAMPAFLSALKAWPRARAIGGPNLLHPDSGAFERGADLVLSSRFGAGRMRVRYAATGAAGATDETALIACNLAIAREQFVGRGFDERFDYGEETLLLARMRRAGMLLVRAPEMAVYHRRRASLLAFAVQSWRSGRGRARQTAVLPGSLPLICLAPPALALVALAAAVFSPARIALGIYLAAGAAHGVLAAARGAGAAAAFWSVVLLPVGHLAYGAGFLAETACLPFRRPG